MNMIYGCFICFLFSDTYTTAVTDVSEATTAKRVKKRLTCSLLEVGKPSKIYKYVWNKNGKRLKYSDERFRVRKDILVLTVNDYQ